jgi:hypothetical protein
MSDKGIGHHPWAYRTIPLEYIPNVTLTYTPRLEAVDFMMNGTVLHGSPAGKCR